MERISRVNALLHREIAEALYKVFAGGGLDLAAVSVTHVETAPNLRNAIVYVSIYGHTAEGEREEILQTLADHAPALQRHINKDCHLKYTPRLRFLFNPSIERGDHVLDTLAHLPDPVEPGDDD